MGKTLLPLFCQILGSAFHPIWAYLLTI